MYAVHAAPQTVTGPSLFDRIVGFVEILVAARNCAVAVNARRRPDAQSLRVLGMEPKSFDNMNLT